MEVIFRPDPATSRLRDPTLLHTHTLHLLVTAGRQDLLSTQRHRRPDVDFPAALALKWLIGTEHVEVPEREAGRQAVALLQSDGVGEVQEAEIGRPFLSAHAHADEFDLGDDEAVAAVVLAHHALQVGEVGEILDVRLALSVTHARVPDLVGFDEADEAAATVGAADGLGGVVCVGGEEVRAVFGRVLGSHGDVAGVALTGFDGGVDLGRVEAGDDVLEGALVGWFEGCVADGWAGERGGFDGDGEEAGGFFSWRGDAA